MPSRIRRSTVMPTSPHSVTRSVGSQLSTCRAFEPYRITTAAWIVISTPSVAMTLTSELARRNGLMITQWVSAPRKADHATPATAEAQNGQPCSCCSSYCMKTPAMAMAPSEKFKMPVPR